MSVEPIEDMELLKLLDLMKELNLEMKDDMDKEAMRTCIQQHWSWKVECEAERHKLASQLVLLGSSTTIRRFFVKPITLPTLNIVTIRAFERLRKALTNKPVAITKYQRQGDMHRVTLEMFAGPGIEQATLTIMDTLGYQRAG
jgi:hypothetical protein